ncbi:MAG: thioredoxin-like domain-containing protein [Bacteroidales bacterium]|nr:thioredoxin-like domain-containing protein [Bacteroidales bacterium]
MWSLFLAVFYNLFLCLNGGSDSPVILALQQGEHVIPIDTLSPDLQGCMTFTGEQVLEPGQYMFVQDNRRLFNFLISRPEPVSIRFIATINKGRTEDIQIDGSEENNAYMRFYRFLQDKYALINNILDSDSAPQEKLPEVERMEGVIREYTHFLAGQFDSCMLGIIARNVFTPQHANGENPMHYLGYIDFTDSRYLNTSILPVRLKEFFTQKLVQQPDTLIRYTDLILKEEMHPRVRAYCARYLFTLFFTSEIMGMERVAVHIANEYFLNNPDLSDDPEMLQEMETYVQFNAQCLTGMKAPLLALPDADGTVRSLDAIQAPYTVVFFFEDNCPACSDELLKLVKLSKRDDYQDVRFYAVYTQNNQGVFEKYSDFFPNNWVTVWDPDLGSEFHRKYNVRSTPRLYLLDRNKTIIGRDIGTETLHEIMEDHRSREQVDLPVAPNITLETENGESYALYDIQAPYTVLYIYDPSCTTCGMVTHLLYQLYKNTRDIEVVFSALYTGNDYKSWRKWLAEGTYTDWINLWNPSGDDRISRHYNINEIPLILLLDKDKKIIADHLSVETLTYILTELMPHDPLF